MNNSPKQPRRKIYLLLVSCVILAISNQPSICKVEASTTPGGILPPPPPPPPQHHAAAAQKLVFGRISTDEDGIKDTNIIISKPLAVESTEEEKLLGSDDEVGALTEKRIIDGNDDDIVLKPIEESKNYESTNDNTWGSSSEDASQQYYTPPSQQFANQNQYQSWGRPEQPQQQTSHIANQYYDQLNRQPQQQSWGQQSYQQPNKPQQNQYYQQQQHQQPYQASQQQTGSPQQQQTGQLAIYNRPPPQPRKSVASGIFSLAVKKLQTGIDTVSDTINTVSDTIVDKKLDSMVSGVSSLTSKIGSTIGSSVGSGRSNSLSAHQMQDGPRRPMQPNAGRGPPGRMGGPPNQRPPPQQRQGQYQPQQMPGPGDPRQQQQLQQQRPSMKKKETFAPPISELYSLGQQQESDHAELSDDEGGDGEPHHVDADATTDDDEDDDMPFPNDMANRQQRQQHPSINGEEQSSQPRQKESQPRIHSIPPQPIEPSSRPQQQRQPPLRNGGAMNPPSNTAPNRRIYKPYDDDDDYYGSSSIGQKAMSILGACIPRVPKIFKRSSMSVYDDGCWSDDESKDQMRRSKAATASRITRSGGGKSSVIPQPVQSLLEKRETLLSTTSARKCTSIGRSQATLYAAQLALVVVCLHEVVPLFLNAISSSAIDTATETTTFRGGIRLAIISTVLSALDGWAPYALAAVFLLSVSNNVWIQPSLKVTYDDAIAENISDEAYTQIYLRLIASLPLSKSLSSEVITKMTRAQASYVASSARMRSFVTMVVIYVLLSTVAVLRPAGVAVVSAIVDVMRLNAWSVSPLDWHVILEGINSVGLTLGQSLKTLFGTELDVIRQQPLRVAIVVSLLSALMFASYLPIFEKYGGGKFGAVEDDNDEEEDEHDTITSLWSNIGATSASRLGILSSPRGVEGALSQFTKLRPDAAASAGITPRKIVAGGRKKRTRRNEVTIFKTILKRILYSTSSIVVLSIPLAIYVYLFASSQADDGSTTLSVNSIPDNGWVSLLELAALLLFTQFQVGTAVNDAIESNSIRLGQAVTTFFERLAALVNEVQKLASEATAGADFQAMMTANPTNGIKISDFWSSHSSRRAWATKGAHLQCRNGEVVLIIGCDGAGKSRLLTAIAEQIFNPPKAARTTTYVRGSIVVSGVDLSKWDKLVLQKRVGVFLNDVRTECDYASLMSGCTIDEILEPVPAGKGHKVGPKERNAVILAMKITGLGSKLLPRLPSKLSTVVTANEDELKPSPLRPPSYPLSPADWNRVILTKVLAQLILGNENQLSSPGIIRKCLIGSILLLDDATSQMSEVDEANMISALRSTGAAVLLTSNRWATGRFADRIVVVDGSSIVESGTHEDLLNLGTERSVYAKQWNAMSSI